MSYERTIETLQRAKQELHEKYRREVAELDEAIARLRSLEPGRDQAGEAGVKPGQYGGMKPAAALQAYLNARGGGPLAVKDVVKELEVGGADLGIPDRHERNLRIMLTHNPKVFRYDESADTVSLIRARTH